MPRSAGVSNASARIVLQYTTQQREFNEPAGRVVGHIGPKKPGFSEKAGLLNTKLTHHRPAGRVHKAIEQDDGRIVLA